MPFTFGLVTVTFRKLTPRQIVDLARDAGLTALEWGGDIHVPPGDVTRAREVAAMTTDAGLTAVAYGSYFRVGEDDVASFDACVASAKLLGAPVIRVWAGKRGSQDADAAYRDRVKQDSHAIASKAAVEGLQIAYEFHAGTLTDTDDSAADLLQPTRHPAIRTLWQPPVEWTIDQCSRSLKRFLPELGHVHVYHWPARGQRAPLADGAAAWKAYLKILADAEKQCPLLLEFVKDDEPEQLISDAATLKQWIGELQ